MKQVCTCTSKRYDRFAFTLDTVLIFLTACYSIVASVLSILLYIYADKTQLSNLWLVISMLAYLLSHSMYRALKNDYIVENHVRNN